MYVYAIYSHFGFATIPLLLLCLAAALFVLKGIKSYLFQVYITLLIFVHAGYTILLPFSAKFAA